MPLADELFDRLAVNRFFTKIDLRSGYHQIRVATENQSKVVFRSRFGHHEFTVMPFGLTNTPATFETAMNDIFRDILEEYVLVYLDYILVYSRTLEDHLRNLLDVLQRLLKHDFYAKLSKCRFAQSKVDFLGHQVLGLVPSPTAVLCAAAAAAVEIVAVAVTAVGDAPRGGDRWGTCMVEAAGVSAGPPGVAFAVAVDAVAAAAAAAASFATPTADHSWDCVGCFATASVVVVVVMVIVYVEVAFAVVSVGDAYTAVVVADADSAPLGVVFGRAALAAAAPVVAAFVPAAAALQAAYVGAAAAHLGVALAGLGFAAAAIAAVLDRVAVVAAAIAAPASIVH
ncbi:hypothetical protein CBR_g27964 [Chara braunii]|uniref:Reverse transcriptase domain-containing protein n=1 Tax=Chara braunii TaxID=69332 RepID=A0A388L8U4_CHABU|nr:hypothetical protein CBR_g27964 [Chara braunii]|eukprot:GBG78740.1 hypothetical protein CBR_g27964 [Chara braunii]